MSGQNIISCKIKGRTVLSTTKISIYHLHNQNIITDLLHKNDHADIMLLSTIMNNEHLIGTSRVSLSRKQRKTIFSPLPFLIPIFGATLIKV